MEKQHSQHFIFFSLQEVGSIIGKKGEIVKRFREEVSYCWQGIKMIKIAALEAQKYHNLRGL